MGRTSVSSLIRVPNPPARITTFIFSLNSKFINYNIILNPYIPNITFNDIIDYKITSEKLYNIDSDNYIFLSISDFGNIYLHHKTEVKAFAKINYDFQKNKYYFDKGSDYFFMFKNKKPIDINKLQIKLLDQTGKILNNNGYDFSFTLEFGQIYDKGLYDNLINIPLSASKHKRY